MAGGITGTAASAATPGQGTQQPWPSRAAAYYGLAVIILATMLNFFDAGVFGLMAQRIKVDFHLTDEELGFLIGPANVIFYVLVGIPMARLVDIYPRKIVLACGIAAIGGITALGGLAQSFKQLFSSRMLVGAGGSAHAPGAYSMLADYFPPLKLPRAIGFLQLGFIGGGTLGAYFGGKLIGMASAWPVSHWHGLTIHGWQWVLMMVGAPGLLIAVLLLLAKEPARRGAAAHGKPLPVKAVLREIGARKTTYLPLFIGLAFSATQSLGVQAWFAPFLIRTYGWNEAQIGKWLGLTLLVSWLLGAALGTAFVEWLAKRYKDANVRAATIMFSIATPFGIIAPMMPSGGLALALPRHRRYVRAGLGRAAKRRNPAHYPKRNARAGHGHLPVHVYRVRGHGRPVDWLDYATSVSFRYGPLEVHRPDSLDTDAACGLQYFPWHQALWARG